MNRKLWNQLGLRSQAALLLHEHLRQLQGHLALSNEFVQNVVGLILGKPYGFDMNYSIENFTAKQANSLAAFMMVASQYFDDQNLSNLETDKIVLTNYDLSFIQRRYDALVFEQKLGDEPQSFNYQGSVGGMNFTNTDANQAILNSQTCTELVKGFALSGSSFRAPLKCSDGVLGGVGTLKFQSEAQEKFIVEFEANLYMANDAGSEIQVHFSQNERFQKGLYVSFANQSEKIGGYVAGGHNNLGSFATKIIANQKRIYRIELDRKQNMLTLKTQSDGTSGWLELSSVNLNAELIPQGPKMNWSFSIANYSSVTRISVLNH